MKASRVYVVALGAALTVAPALARVDFKPIVGGEFIVPVDISADGTRIVASGYFGQPYYIWTAADGLVEIGGGCTAGQVSISADGATIVGSAYDENGICQAAKWLDGQSWLTMGSEPGAVPCGSDLSSTFDNNGTTAVGLFWRAQECKAIGGTWDLASGTAGPELSSTVPDRPTRGNGITDDGSIVVGWQDAETGERQAVKWVNGVQEYITNADGSRNGEATGVNADGSVIWGVGFRYDGYGRGWIYRAGKGIVAVGGGNTQGGGESVPLDVTDDGSTAVGVTRTFATGVQKGWIWTDKKGLVDLNDSLKGQGASGWDLIGPGVISRDGRYVSGFGINPDGTPQMFIIDYRASGSK